VHGLSDPGLKSVIGLRKGTAREGPTPLLENCLFMMAQRLRFTTNTAAAAGRNRHIFHA